MPANAETMPQQQQSGPPKRRLRNFLLNPRFQLKYTGMVVAVSVVVACILGYLVYQHSTDLTAAVTAADMINAMTPEAQELLIEESEAQDRRILYGIIGGIVLLALALGVTGIVVTHKVVGPTFKLKRLIRDVAGGHLKIEGRLRKGDELQDLFIAFEEMVASLRERQVAEIVRLDEAIEKAKASGASDEAVAEIVAVRDDMQKTLD